jgi:putative secretion ATPase (PEP-CTERM system associated)
MYERFYQLKERPFALSPDPEYLYPSRVHQEALDYLRYGLESQAGFIVITGEIGSGKTTLLQTLLRNIDNQTTVGRIVNTMLDPRELLESIMIDFGLDPAGRSKPLMVRDLSQYLVDQRLAGRLVLLVIDEAQNLGLGALEELRMLSNLETEKSKLVQIVLVGQPNLREKLSAPELEQLRQRITVSYHLPPLDSEETFKYINHRLRHAALDAPLAFPRAATDLIHARSGGVPRIINVICDATLVFGYAEERRMFDARVILEVLDELETTGVLPPASSISAAARRDTAIAAAAPGSEPGPAATPAPAPVTATAAMTPAPAPATAPLQTPAYAASAAKPVAPARPAPALEPVAVATSGTGRGADSTSVELQRREAAVRQREAELAEQRRILAEEYRLLRTQRATAAAVNPEGSLQFQVVGGAPTTFDRLMADRFKTERSETFWTRLKRFMLGVSPS